MKKKYGISDEMESAASHTPIAIECNSCGANDGMLVEVIVETKPDSDRWLKIRYCLHCFVALLPKSAK